MTVCGTGFFNGPKPGDPDNNVALSASPAFGGIDVAWTYPAVNPAAVAHVLLFRAITPVFDGALEIAVVAGNRYYDKLDTGTTYYYWIKIVSVNGTVADAVGPASATARPLIGDLIEQLTGQIDAGVLAQSLKGTLDQISILGTNLSTEIFDRETGETSFAAALLDVQNGVAQANTFITTEINSRTTADSALAEQIDLVAATLGDQIASVTISADAWVTPLADANDKITAIGARYTAQVTVDGLVGGFGIFNDGTTVDAGFDVDTFWVGKTAANKRKPFIIVGSETFIDQAVIDKLTFSKLTDEAGTFIVADGKVQAAYLKVSTASIDDAAITNAKVANLDATKINTGFLDAARIQVGSLDAKIATIGNAQIANAAINELKIAGNSVTIPVSAATAGPITSVGSGGIEVTLLTLPTFVSKGGQILIQFGTVEDFNPTAGDNKRLIVRRNGVQLGSFSIGATGSMVTPPVADVPGAGAVVSYTLSTEGTATVNYTSITGYALETIR